MFIKQQETFECPKYNFKLTQFAKYKMFNNLRYSEWPKMASFSKQLGYLSNENIFLKIHNMFFHLYQNLCLVVFTES